MRNVFRLEKKNKTFKERMNRDMRNIFEHEEELYRIEK